MLREHTMAVMALLFVLLLLLMVAAIFLAPPASDFFEPLSAIAPVLP